MIPVRGKSFPLLGIAFVLAALTGCGEPDTEPVLRGLVLRSLESGAPVSTDALMGKPLLVNVWATWCGPCRSEMPALERLARGSGSIEVIGVSVDSDLNLAREFVRARGLTFGNYADGPDGALQRALAVKALPETLLVAADGRIAARVTGARAWDEEEGARLLARILGQPGRGTPRNDDLDQIVSD